MFLDIRTLLFSFIRRRLFFLMTIASTATLYLAFRASPTLAKLGAVFQQVFTAQEPETP